MTLSIRQRTSQVLIAQILGDGEGHVGGLAALQGRLVGGGDHHDGAGQPLRPQRLLDELAHLAAPLADQADHHRVAGGVAGQHREQHRLADAGAGEDAEPLAAAAGGEDVHGPHAELEPLADPAAGMGRRRRGAQRIGRQPLRQRALAVDRLAERVDHPAQPAHRRPHRRAFGPNADLRAGRNPLQRAERHQQGARLAKADHLGLQRRRAAAIDLGARADRQPGQAAARLDQQAVDRSDAAGNHQRIDTLDGGDEIAQQLPRISARDGRRRALSIG